MLCPKCNTEMRYTKGQKEKIVSTLSGLKEWTFKGFWRCKKGSCRHVIEINDEEEARMPKRYRKKPVIVEAIQFNGLNFKEIIEFTKGKAFKKEGVGSSANGNGYPQHYESFYINTLEGEMLTSINDWVIKGIKGEFYPCKPDIFNKTYDEVI
jgi:hypothetical protein